MAYQIAQEGERRGEATATLRAEINLGLKQGYDGFLQEKAAVVAFLKGEYRSALENGRKFIPVGIQETILVYAYPTDNGARAEDEPSLTLFSDKNPLYATESDEEWKASVESLASKLAEQFRQYRVYVTYTAVEVKIFQQA